MAMLKNAPADAAPQSDLPTPVNARARAKIVCTVGPSCCTQEQIREVLQAGASVFRFNFSHAAHDWATEVLEIVRKEAAQQNLPIAIMQDLCGPKIRVNVIPSGALDVAVGDELRITTDLIQEQEAEKGNDFAFDFSTGYATLLEDTKPGDTILVNDGRVALNVVEKLDTVLRVNATRGGRITKGKGLNLPGVSLSTHSVTAKDWRDLEWAINNNIEFVALSFVRQVDDVLELRMKFDELGCATKVIAKIERPEAIECLDEIITITDGLMVARGDLGMETELTRVPMLQKQLIETARVAGKPVITATQMLDSMVNDSTPTRAEVSDVANAIFDGTDAIMLSDETAAGKFPIEAVKVLTRIAHNTEEHLGECFKVREIRHDSGPVDAITLAAARIAIDIDAACVVVYSQSGHTAKQLARYRLPIPVVAVTNMPATYSQLSLSFGVCPVLLPGIDSLSELLDVIDGMVVEQKWGDHGDQIVVVSSLDGRHGDIDNLNIWQLR